MSNYLQLVSFGEIGSGHAEECLAIKRIGFELGLEIAEVNIGADGTSNVLPQDMPTLLIMNASSVATSVRAIRNYVSMKIGAIAAWELPNPPNASKEFSPSLDYLFAISSFNYACFANVFPKTTYLPPIIEPPAAESLPRSSFPQKPFEFFYIFNFGSYVARKNPFGLIKAFWLAFHKHDWSVALTIKVSSTHLDEASWSDLEHMAGLDRRIKLISAHLANAELQKLYQSTDCYVSLHRSEGFGRTIAEAMLAEKPVIATNWSGSTDLVTSETGFPCEYELRPLYENEYIETEGQYWAEPNLEHAAYLMHKVRHMHETELAKITEAAKKHIVQRFSLQANEESYKTAFDLMLDA